MRVEFEYERGGALAYLAAWDVRRAKIFGFSRILVGAGGKMPVSRSATRRRGAEG
jgi:hypothetical protein